MTLALSKGLYMVADGRFYISAVHRQDDIQETLDVVSAVLDQMGAVTPASP